MTTKYVIEFEIVTPMFIAGANQKQDKFFRLPSFKGVLRFWWRAVAYSKFKDIKKMSEEEGKIFGSTGQASKIHLNLTNYSSKQRRIDFRNRNGLIYLGYGVVHFRGHTIRPYISPSTSGRIEIFCDLESKQIPLLEQALKAFAFFGNMGSKARKGYGSINFRKILKDGTSIYSQPKSINELEQSIKNFFSQNRFINFSGLPPFSAFSKSSRIDILENDIDALSLQNKVGEQMAFYRSYGRNGKVFGRPAERNFQQDHNLIKNMQNRVKPTKHPKRIVFGLPHNYFFGSSRFKASVEPDSNEMTRRASPLFIKILKTGEKYVAVSLILKSQFLPSNTRIKIKSRRTGNSVPAKVEWSVLEDFLDKPSKFNRIRFPNKKTIYP